MNIKIFQSMSETKVEKQVNEFISRNDVKVIELKFQATIFYFSVMVVYEPVTGGWC